MSFKRTREEVNPEMERQLSNNSDSNLRLNAIRGDNIHVVNQSKKVIGDLTDIPVMVLSVETVSIQYNDKEGNKKTFPTTRAKVLVTGLDGLIKSKIQQGSYYSGFDRDDYIGVHKQPVGQEKEKYSFGHSNISSQDISGKNPAELYEIRKKELDDIFCPMINDQHYYKKVPVQIEMPNGNSTLKTPNGTNESPLIKMKGKVKLQAYNDMYGESVLTTNANEQLYMIDYPRAGIRDGQIISVSFTPIKDKQTKKDIILNPGDHLLLARLNGTSSLKNLDDAFYYYDDSVGKTPLKHYFITGVFLNAKYVSQMQPQKHYCHTEECLSMFYNYKKAIDSKIEKMSSGSNEVDPNIVTNLIARGELISHLRSILFTVARTELHGLSHFQRILFEWYLCKEIMSIVNGMTLQHSILLAKNTNELQGNLLKRLLLEIDPFEMENDQEDHKRHLSIYRELLETIDYFNVKKFDLMVQDKDEEIGIAIPSECASMAFPLDNAFEIPSLPFFAMAYNVLNETIKLEQQQPQQDKNMEKKQGDKSSSENGDENNDGHGLKKSNVPKNSFLEIFPLSKDRFSGDEKKGKLYMDFGQSPYVGESKSSERHIWNIAYKDKASLDVNEVFSCSDATPKFEETDMMKFMKKSFEKTKKKLRSQIENIMKSFNENEDQEEEMKINQEDINDDDDSLKYEKKKQNDDEDGIPYSSFGSGEIQASQPADFDDPLVIDYSNNHMEHNEDSNDSNNENHDQKNKNENVDLPISMRSKISGFQSWANVYNEMDLSSRISKYNLFSPGGMSVVKMGNVKYFHADKIPSDPLRSQPEENMSDEHQKKQMDEKKKKLITYEPFTSPTKITHIFNNLKSTNINQMNFSTFNLDLYRSLKDIPVSFAMTHLNIILDDMDVIKNEKNNIISMLSYKYDIDSLMEKWAKRSRHTIKSYTSAVNSYGKNSDQLAQNKDNHCLFPLIAPLDDKSKEGELKDGELRFVNLKKNPFFKYVNLLEVKDNHSYIEILNLLASGDKSGSSNSKRNPILKEVDEIYSFNAPNDEKIKIDKEIDMDKLYEATNTEYISLKSVIDKVSDDDMYESYDPMQRYRMGCIFGLSDNNYVNYSGPNLILSDSDRKYVLSQPIYGSDFTLYELLLSRRHMEEIFDSARDDKSKSNLYKWYVLYKYYDGDGKWKIDIDAILKYLTIKLIHDTFVIQMLACSTILSGTNPKLINNAYQAYQTRFSTIQNSFVEELMGEKKNGIKIESEDELKLTREFIEEYIQPHIGESFGTVADWINTMKKIKVSCISKLCKEVHPLLFLTFTPYFCYEDVEEGKCLSDIVIGLEKKYSKVSSKSGSENNGDESKSMVTVDHLEVLKEKKKRKIQEAFGYDENNGEPPSTSSSQHDEYIGKEEKKKKKKKKTEVVEEYKEEEEESKVHKEIDVPTCDSENEEMMESQISSPKEISVSNEEGKKKKKKKKNSQKEKQTDEMGEQ